MNTPKPCDTCKHLYWVVLQEEDPTDRGECKKNLCMGDLNCPEYSLHSAEIDSTEPAET